MKMCWLSIQNSIIVILPMLKGGANRNKEKGKMGGGQGRSRWKRGSAEGENKSQRHT